MQYMRLSKHVSALPYARGNLSLHPAIVSQTPGGDIGRSSFFRRPLTLEALRFEDKARQAFAKAMADAPGQQAADKYGKSLPRLALTAMFREDTSRQGPDRLWSDRG
jgi:hypothetical protein